MVGKQSCVILSQGLQSAVSYKLLDSCKDLSCCTLISQLCVMNIPLYIVPQLSTVGQIALFSDSVVAITNIKEDIDH